jgi:hypothetical protein
MLAEIGGRGIRREIIDAAAALSPHERDALRRALDPDPHARITSARALAAAWSL